MWKTSSLEQNWFACGKLANQLTFSQYVENWSIRK